MAFGVLATVYHLRYHRIGGKAPLNRQTTLLCGATVGRGVVILNLQMQDGLKLNRLPSLDFMRYLNEPYKSNAHTFFF